MTCPYCGKKYLYAAQDTKKITFHCSKCNNDSIVVKQRYYQKDAGGWQVPLLISILPTIAKVIFIVIIAFILRFFHIADESPVAALIISLIAIGFLFLFLVVAEKRVKLEKKSLDQSFANKMST
jgi:hypothetical protein